MPPFWLMVRAADGPTGVDYQPMLMAKSLCYDAVIAAT
jgi:hypothetical protein